METDTNQNAPTTPTTEGTEIGVEKPTTIEVKDPAARFRGHGTSFKAKLIGIDDVLESRGDKMCQESILKLKAAVKASGQHKQKIIVNVSLKGLRIINLLNGEVEHEHPVHRISFIARDLTDRRAFGYIFGAGEGKHKFFGIKTAKIAEHLVLALRDLFQVVYDLKKQEMEQAKQESENGPGGNEEETYAVPNNKPAPQAQGNSLFDIEQQLQDIQQITDSNAFNPWPENAPTSPDTPGNDMSNSMFGMPNLSDISSLSSEFSLASATSSVAESKLPLSEPKTPQSDQFHRTLSGKSATSWHGHSGSHHWPSFKSDKKKRHGSMSGQSGNNNTNEKPPTGKILTKSNSVGRGDLTLDHKTHDKQHDEKTDSNHDSSFFEEVMVATGFKASSETLEDQKSLDTPEEKHKPVENSVDTSENVSDSMSSISSTNSKTSTPRKSLSITNLFFSSKSDKNKNSLKRKHKHLNSQKSASSGAILSENTAHSPVAPNTQTPSSRLQRTSSSSSTTSSERNPVSKLSRGYSSASISSAPDTTKNDMRTNERVPPPLAHARARPRAQSSMSLRVANKDSHNPPMFKSKQAGLQKQSSMSSIDSNTSTSSRKALSTVPDDNDDANSLSAESWAKFDEMPNAEDTKSVTDDQTSKKTDSAWTSSEPEAHDVQFSSTGDCFNDSFSPDSGATKTISEESKSTKTDIFENCDPFGDIMLDDPFKDPFNNVEEMFGNMLSDNDCTETKSNSNVAEESKPIDQMPRPDSPELFSQNSDSPFNVTDTALSEHSTQESPVLHVTSSLDDLHSSQHSSSDSNSSDSESPAEAPEIKIPPPPPPLPPRLPKRVIVSNDEEITLPPAIPPPPLPPCIVSETPNDTYEGHSETSSDGEELSGPPDCKPPDLPPIENTFWPDTNLCPPIPSRNPPKSHDSNLRADEVSANLQVLSSMSSSSMNSSDSEAKDIKNKGCNIPKLKQPPRVVKRNRAQRKVEKMQLGNADDNSSSSSYSFASNRSDPDGYLAGSSSSPSEPADGGMTKNSSYSDQLSNAFSMPAEQPAPVPGGKLTKDQIIASFNGAQVPQGMPGQAMGGYYGQQGQPQQAMYQQPSVPGMGGAYGARPNMPQQNPFGQGYPVSQPSLGVAFPSGPSPAVPARPGAMRPPAPVAAQTGAAQNPFGDALSPTSGLLAPVSNNPVQQNGTEEEKKKTDPFASLVPGLGGGSAPTNKKDMFKNFQMAKPTPPPRSGGGGGDSVSANFENYMMQSVGGVPLDDANNNAAIKPAAPSPAPRSMSQDAFGGTPANGANSGSGSGAEDPFAMFGSVGGSSFDQPFNFASPQQQPPPQQSSMSDSLFG